jgi:hypothetical protein
MRNVVVATHGHCFDGLCSAVMFTRLLRHVRSGEELAFTYRAMGYGPGARGATAEILSGDDNAILDYRFSPEPALTWYFDHHVSAFGSEGDRAVYERAREASPRQMFHDGGYGSCTKLIADIGRASFGLDTRDCEELVRWADMIDSAAFPSAEMAVKREDPVLHLMTVVEQHGDDAFLSRMVPRLLEEPLSKVARGQDVEEAFRPLDAQHKAFVDLVKARARVAGSVVVVDLGDAVLDIAPKFVTYALYPETAYSVVLTRAETRCKISIGYNPWSPIARKHNIAAMCERYGGGGHPVVGAIATRADELERAREIVATLENELAS